MATLTEDIDATQKVIRVSGSTPDQGHFRIRIDDELMDVEGFDRKQLDGGYRDPGVDRTRWIVTRGVGGTTQASHSAGDTLKAATSALVSGETLTPPLPFAGEGGAAPEGTVVVTPPSEVDIAAALEGAASPSATAPYTTIVTTETRTVFADIVTTSTTVTGAYLALDVGWLISGFGIPDGATVVSVNEGAGTAVISVAATETESVTTRVTEPDPGAVGAGGLWLRHEPSGLALNVSLSIRDESDSFWIALGPSFYDANGWLIGQIAQDSSSELVIRGYPRNLAADLMQFSLVPGYGLVIDGGSSLVHFENLPTADPGTGGLWVNAANAGALTIGAG